MERHPRTSMSGRISGATTVTVGTLRQQASSFPAATGPPRRARRGVRRDSGRLDTYISSLERTFYQILSHPGRLGAEDTFEFRQAPPDL